MNRNPDIIINAINSVDAESSDNKLSPPLSKISINANDKRPSENLFEFYSFMNNDSNKLISLNNSTKSKDLDTKTDFKNRGIDRQPSLNTFTSFSASVLNLPTIVTSNDFKHTMEIYDSLLDKAENLRMSLLMVSQAANEFGQSLESVINDCPKVINSKTVSDGLINAGSLQYMIGSNQQILSRLILQSFQEPLSKELKKLKDQYEFNFNYYQHEIKEKSILLRKKELENLKLSKSRIRNLTVYKNNLLNLTNQIEEIDRLKHDFYYELHSIIDNFNSKYLLTRTGSLVRAQLEIYESIAKKGWTGGGLDNLLAISPDLFEINYDIDINQEPEYIDKDSLIIQPNVEVFIEEDINK